MHVLLAHQQINGGNCQHDGKQYDGGCRCIRRISAAITIEHIVYITYYGVHFRRIQIRSKQSYRITIGLESTYETGDYQIKKGGRDHGQGNFSKYTEF